VSSAPAPHAASLSVVVPVYNEQHLVEASLRRLEVLGHSPLLRRVQVLVIDNGSTDQSPQILRRFQNSLDRAWGGGKFDWHFIRLDKNQGRGGGILKGIELADCELTVTHDADLEYYPADLLKMVPLFSEEQADAVIGSRFKGGEFRRLLFLRHALGNRLVTFLGGLICNLDLSDIATCYKMVRTELLQSIPFESRDFRMEVELAIKLAKRHARIFEVPIRYSGRTHQQGKKLRLRDVMTVLMGLAQAALSNDIYKEDRFASHIRTRLQRAPRFSAWLADMLRPYLGQAVLELGAGIGYLTMHFTPRELYWATDSNPLYLDNLRRLSPNQPYLHTRLTDIAEAGSFPAGVRFDTVVCRHVLENVADDLAALRNMHRALEERGRALVVVPQGPKLYGAIDEALGHCRRYTRQQLMDVCTQAGFHVQTVIGFNRAGSLAWWWDGKVRRRRNVGSARMRMINLLVPLLRRVDRWIPLPPLSLIAVLEKLPGVSSPEETAAAPPVGANAGPAEPAPVKPAG
jgi:glycosyltransferase involved in cell wall biosynthesis